MNLLDVIVSPLSRGDSATVIFSVGLGLVLLVCGGTAALLTLHFRKERKREEKRKEKHAEKDDRISEI